MTPHEQQDLEARFLAHVKAIELPGPVMAQLIMTAAKEDWTREQYRYEIARAKFKKYFDDMLVEVEAEIAVLREGSDEEC